MHNKTSTKPITLILLLLSAISFNAQAAFHDSRVGKWEFYLAPQITDSKDLQFDNGSSANLEQDSSLGFGIGYNINSRIELALEFVSNNTNYTSTAIPEDPNESPITSRGSMYKSTINFGFTFNFLTTPFTPYVTANMGSTYIDSGIYTGNIGTGCYWYPYWGYICSPVAQTYTTTEFSYGAALGLRYDFNRKLYMKGEARKSFIDAGNNNTPDFDTLRLIFGFMF